jgi:hypothetical protein
MTIVTHGKLSIPIFLQRVVPRPSSPGDPMRLTRAYPKVPLKINFPISDRVRLFGPPRAMGGFLVLSLFTVSLSQFSGFGLNPELMTHENRDHLAEKAIPAGLATTQPAWQSGSAR